MMVRFDATMASDEADIVERLARAVRAGVRGFALAAAEESATVALLEEVGDGLGWPVHTWSAATGVDGDRSPRPLDALLRELRDHHDEALWILLDAAASIDTPQAVRALRELAQRETGPAVMMLDVTGSLERGSLLERIPELWLEELPPPSLSALEAHLRWVASELDSSGHRGADDRLRPALGRLARAALGLDRLTLDRLLAQAVLAHGPDPAAIEAFITQHKPRTLDRTGLLESVQPADITEVGGLEALKQWLQRRALALHPRAREVGIPDPRGVLLLGVQGCGKSLAARACAGVLGLPLVRLEPGRLFGGTVGESEANLRRATAAAQRMAPVVLWLDEVDKGLSGIDGSASDGGTAARVVGGLLTWLQERTRPVFVIATANRVDHLPPELLRRGRLDEIFFVDLPGPQEREAILRVHLEVIPRMRLGTVPPLADPPEAFAAVIRDADGLSGAEIEAALVEARLEAFADGRDPSADDLRRAVGSTVPLSVTRAESIAALRHWAQTRARRA
jgi:AAA+ superfamily predicted ATPase